MVRAVVMRGGAKAGPLVFTLYIHASMKVSEHTAIKFCRYVPEVTLKLQL